MQIDILFCSDVGLVLLDVYHIVYNINLNNRL